MERRTFIATAGAIAPMALAGCLGNTEGTEGPTGSSNASTGRAITVSASGEQSGDPDLAVLQLGVEARADSAEEARSELAADVESLLAALEDEGIPEEDITTDRFRIRERIDRRAAERDGVDPRDERIDEYRYYEGTHTFRVELHDIERVGDVIDTAVGAGADDVGRVTFTLSEEKRSKLREEALRKAISNARGEAETIADEVGATIVEVTLVDASDGRITPVQREMTADDAPRPEPEPEPDPATAIEPGEVTVTVNIQIQYEIEG